MSSETSETDAVALEQPGIAELGLPISAKVVLMSMAGGLLGTVLMLPVLVGVPQALGLFRTEPITQFAGFAAFFGIEPTATLGMVVFGLGGTFVLPLIFLVVGSFLPPREPRYLRGMTFATFFWTGFAPAFWPGTGVVAVAVFLVVSLLAHWVYGATLGYVLHRTTGIPQHDV
jgi:phage shock protein PspC (stress-responsive transcriptional regulator)